MARRCLARAMQSLPEKELRGPLTPIIVNSIDTITSEL
jgi:hypothetical protein